MSIPTIHAGARFYKVTPATADLPGNPFIELGVAGTQTLNSMMAIQFNPSVDFAGNFAIMARTMGAASDLNDTPFVPVPYRIGSLNDVAQITAGQGWPWVSDLIASSALIFVPSSGLSICVLNGLSAGSMSITTWDVNGNSAV